MRNAKQTNRIKLSVVDSIIKRPKTFLCLSLLFFSFFLPGIANIGQDFSYKIWYSDSDELMQLYKKFESKFGNDDAVVIGVETQDGFWTNQKLSLLLSLTEKLWLLPDVTRVDSIMNHEFIEASEDEIEVISFFQNQTPKELSNDQIKSFKNKVLADQMLKNYLISEDGTVAIFQARIRPAFDRIPDYSKITLAARKLINELQTQYPNERFHLVGSIPLTHMFKEISFKDMGLLAPLCTIIFLIIMVLIYRHALGFISPFIIIISSITMMFGVMGYLDHKLNTLSSASPTILLTVAIADAIHILTVYFFGLKKGFNNKEAVRYTLSKNFYPTLLTSITTAVGFISFTHSKVLPVAFLGESVFFGVIFAWINTYFMLGPILCLFPAKKYLRIDREEVKELEELEESIKATPKTMKFIEQLMDKKSLIVATTIIVSIITIIYSAKLEVNMDPIQQFPKSNQIHRSFKFLENKLGSIATMEIMIDSHKIDGIKDPKYLKNVERFENWLNQQSYIDKTISILDILRSVNKTFHGNKEEYYRIADTRNEIAEQLFFYGLGLPQGRELTTFVSLQNDALRITAQWNIHSSVIANQKIAEINAKAREYGLDAHITGKMPLFHELTPYVVDTFLKSFLMAFTIITILLVVVLKSLKLGVLALIPNLFPLFVGAAVYQILGFDVDMSTVLIASVCLGIAVDDSIHFLFEFKKYRGNKKSLHETFSIIFTNTFPSLFFTTLLVVIGFGSFIIANYVPNAKFGGMVAFVLIIALIADFIVLPAVLASTEKIK